MQYAKTALVYLNKEGEKTRVKAGTIFDDAPEADIERWTGTGNVREATVGEIAEAVASGALDPKYAPGAPEKKLTAAEKKAAAADKAAADKAAADKAAADKAAAGENGGAPKRQDIV